MHFAVILLSTAKKDRTVESGPVTLFASTWERWGVTPLGFEPRAHGLKVHCSARLSYGVTKKYSIHTAKSDNRTAWKGVAVLSEDQARKLVAEAVDRLGGNRYVVGSPRHPFSLNADREEEVEGFTVIVRYGEVSSPAIAEVEGWVFEVREDELPLRDKPRRRRNT